MTINIHIFEKIITDTFHLGFTKKDYSVFEKYNSSEVQYRIKGQNFSVTVADAIYMLDNWHASFSNFTTRVDKIVIQDNEAVALIMYSGLHTGKFRNIEPTNKQMSFEAVLFFTFKDNKVVAIREVFDEGALLSSISA